MDSGSEMEYEEEDYGESDGYNSEGGASDAFEAPPVVAVEATFRVLTPEQCLDILAKHLRVTPARAREIARVTKTAYEDRRSIGEYAAMHAFEECVNQERARWGEEALEGAGTIARLASSQAEKEAA